MLRVDIARVDVHGEHQAVRIAIVRKEPHHRLKRAYWYEYTHIDDKGQEFVGRLVHSYENGAVTLVQKVTKDIVRQQREIKRKKSEGQSG